MSKIIVNKPTLIMLYGFPGSGKTYVAGQLKESLNCMYVHSDRIRSELFENPRYDKDENEVVDHLSRYMTGEFLKAGVGVIYDGDVMKQSQRRILTNIARSEGAKVLLIWLQLDPESAFYRIRTRDKRRSDDKIARHFNRSEFEDYLKTMQNPKIEDYVVISGKHTFRTQRTAIIKKLYELGVVTADSATHNVVKPGMVNLIPNSQPGRVDQQRRNIFIRS